MDSSPFFRIGLEENGLGELACFHVDSSLREAELILRILIVFVRQGNRVEWVELRNPPCLSMTFLEL